MTKMTTRWVRLSKKITTPDLVVGLYVFWYSGQITSHWQERFKIRLRSSSGLPSGWKLDSSQQTVSSPPAQRLVDRAWHHFNRMRRCTGVRDKRLDGLWEHKFHSHSLGPYSGRLITRNPVQWLVIWQSLSFPFLLCL